MGKPDACVSGGAFDDSAAGFQQAVLLGILNDEESSAVFDTATRILKFGFA